MARGALYYEAKVGIGAAGGAATKQLQNVSCGVGKTGQILVKDGVRGTRSRHTGNAVAGPYSVGGPLSVQPSPDELRIILPYIFGTAESGSGTSGTPWIYALAETIGDMVVVQEKIAKVFTWDGCKVNNARFSASAGSPVLTLDMDVQGKTEAVGAAASFPSIGTTLSTVQPWVFHNLVLTLNSITRVCDNFSITIDNGLMLDRFLNSQTRTEIPETDRSITLEVDNPYSTTDLALYDIAATGIAGSAVFTNGTNILTFTFANLKAPAEVMEAAQRGEIMNKLRFTAYETGTPGSTTKELVTTLSTS
jgi:hypothetical protein